MVLVERSSGIAALVAAMAAHEGAVDVQIHAIWALINLCDSHEIQLRVVNEGLGLVVLFVGDPLLLGGLDAVARALRVHVANIDLCRAAMIALVNFCDKGENLVLPCGVTVPHN